MMEVTRISPSEARQKTRSGNTLLVCAYESEEICKRNRLEGALSLQQFNSRVPQLDKKQEIVFYCA